MAGARVLTVLQAELNPEHPQQESSFAFSGFWIRLHIAFPICASLWGGFYFIIFSYSKWFERPLSALWREGASVPSLHLLPISQLLDSSGFPFGRWQLWLPDLPFPRKTQITNRSECSAQFGLGLFTKLEMWLLPAGVYKLYIPAEARMSHFYIAHRK